MCVCVRVCTTEYGLKVKSVSGRAGAEVGAEEDSARSKFLVYGSRRQTLHQRGRPCTHKKSAGTHCWDTGSNLFLPKKNPNFFRIFYRTAVTKKNCSTFFAVTSAMGGVERRFQKKLMRYRLLPLEEAQS